MTFAPAFRLIRVPLGIYFDSPRTNKRKYWGTCELFPKVRFASMDLPPLYSLFTLTLPKIILKKILLLTLSIKIETLRKTSKLDRACQHDERHQRWRTKVSWCATSSPVIKRSCDTGARQMVHLGAERCRKRGRQPWHSCECPLRWFTRMEAEQGGRWVSRWRAHVKTEAATSA